MTDEADPYLSPTATPPPLHAGRDKQGWQVLGGALWVKDEASLPDICLDGSIRTRRSGPARLDLTYQLFHRMMLAGTFIGTGILVVLALRQSLGLMGFSLTMVILTIVFALISAAFSKWKGERKSITIHRSIGLRTRLRSVIVSLVSMAVFILAFLLLGHFSRTLQMPQRQQIGLSQALLFVLCMTQTLGLQSAPVRAVETENGWYRLKGVHPLAVASLARVQAAEGDDSSA